MFSTLAIFAASAAVAAAANSTSSGFDNTNVNYPYVLTPAQIATYNQTVTSPWCEAQRNTCPQMCGGQAFPNTCDPVTLNWSCKCTVGTTPNVTMYIQTIPFFECQEWKRNCVASYTDAYNQQQCNNVACGSIDASKNLASFSSSAAMASTAAAAAATAASTVTAVVSTTAAAGGAAATTATNVVSAATSAAAAAATTAAKAAGNKAMELSSLTFGAGLLAFLGLAI